VYDYFKREVLPVPDAARASTRRTPFPRVFNKSLNLIVELEGRDAFGRGSRVAIVQAPRILPRAIRLPPSIGEGEYSFVYLTSVLHAHVNELFAGMTVKGAYQFRVTRNSELFVDEEEIKNLRIALQGELMQRHFGDAVRLEVVEEISPADDRFPAAAVPARRAGPLSRGRAGESLSPARGADGDRPPGPQVPAFTPSVPAAIEVGDDDLFETIARQDVLLHHPYQSFAPVLDFIRSSVYRPARGRDQADGVPDGRGVRADADPDRRGAGREGGDRRRRAAGALRRRGEPELGGAAGSRRAHVVYGVVGHKTHAKMALIVRREPGP
jgi:polyphosphate kinase